jgi:hypothetical protein
MDRTVFDQPRRRGEQRGWDGGAERLRPPASNPGRERRQENSSRSLISKATSHPHQLATSARSPYKIRDLPDFHRRKRVPEL